jgi:hypothetical protein
MLSIVARADDAPALLMQLGSEHFDVREKAESQLLALGPAVLPALKEAIASTEDAETRARAKRVAERIVVAGKLEKIYKEYGNDPLKLEVAARMMTKVSRHDDARLLFRAAAQVCKEIADGKTKHPMGPEMARRKADELEMRSIAEAPARGQRGVRVIRGNGAAQIFVNGLQVQMGGEIDEQLIEALDINNGVLQIGE